MNNFRKVVLTSHWTLERLIHQHLRPQVEHVQDPLLFAYHEHVGVEDTVLFVLHSVHV